MANRRVVELQQQTPSTHPTAQRSSHKRKLPTQSTIQRDAFQNRGDGQENRANQPNTQQSKRRRRVQRSGKAPRPEGVIVIDSGSEEEESKHTAQATTTSAVPSASNRPVRAPVTAAVMEQLESDDYFQVLGLSRDATDADVKKAYRKLAIQWHPDKNRDHPRAEEFFKKIGEAYAVLSDPDKRKLYERVGKKGLNGGAGSPDSPSRGSPDGFGFSGHSDFTYHRARDIFEAFFGGMDPFAELFSPHARRRSRQGHRQSQSHSFEGFDDDIGDRGFGPGFVVPLMMGFGGGGLGMSMGFGGSRRGVGGFGGLGGGLMDSFFSDEFPGFSGAGGGGGGGGFASHSVSTTSFTDRNGQTVMKKTTTTVNADGRAETVTEEYRNGRLVDSSSNTQATSRLAGAGRMQLDTGGATTPAPSSRDGQRRLQSGGRLRSKHAP